MAARKKRKKIQTTKIIIAFVLINAEIDIQLSYVLALLGRENIAEALSEKLIVEVIGVVLIYAVKSYFETKQEKKTETQRKIIDAEYNGNETEEQQGETEAERQAEAEAEEMGEP